jgi:hypothetical protein
LAARAVVRVVIIVRFPPLFRVVLAARLGLMWQAAVVPLVRMVRPLQRAAQALTETHLEVVVVVAAAEQLSRHRLQAALVVTAALEAVVAAVVVSA